MKNLEESNSVNSILVETYVEKNYSWPGTADNPMRPVYAKNPFTGEDVMVNYNDRNLFSDKEYRNAGFIYITGRGWCWEFTK